MEKITCCYGCVPPKRHPACSATCPEYAEQKAKVLKEKRILRKIANESKTISAVQWNGYIKHQKSIHRKKGREW